MAQTGGGVGIGGTAPASAALSVSSTTKGFLPPRMTQAERDLISAPTAGLVIYNTTTNKLNTWNGTSWDASLSATEQAGSAVTSFAYTGAPQTFVVPPGVTSLQVTAEGGGGGQYPYGAGNGTPGMPGGVGARVTATLTVTPGETLTVYVGGRGSASTVGNSPGGYNGGATGDNFGGGGGGATDLRRATATADAVGLRRMLVAGGGGGGGYSTTAGESAGGNGGTPAGSNGQGGFRNLNGGGIGGTQSGPGGNAVANVGGEYQNPGTGGGSGGGGYYGGGGAMNNGGGGGGASWVLPAGSSGISYGVAAAVANGSLTITAAQFVSPTLDGTNFVNVPGTYPQLALSGQTLSLSTGSSVTLPASTDAQRLSLSGQSLSISNGNTITLPANTDAQQLSKSGSLISLTNGGSVVDADNQSLSLSGSSLSIGGGTGVTLPDASSTNEIQSLSLSGSTLGISGGSGVTLPDASSTNEIQSLTLNGQNLTISGGNTIALPSDADNLGNHIATQNLNLGANKLVGNSGTVGLVISADGNVGIGATPATQKLDVDGGILARSFAPISNQGAYLQWNRTGGAGETWLINQQGGGGGGMRFGGATTANVVTEWARFESDGRLGVGSSNPAASAQLDVSSTTKGFLPPRMSQTQRDAIGSPAVGLTLYNTLTNKLNTWNGTSWDAALSATEQVVQNPVVTFGYTGGVQTYTVPAGVYRLTIDATGAAGGGTTGNSSGAANAGGTGARVRATLAVTPGQQLLVRVGGAGGYSDTRTVAGGYNGGGSTSGGGSGGGATDVRTSGGQLTDRLLVAAGGGGGGNVGSGSQGGNGGAPNGGNGNYTNGNSGPQITTSSGATQTSAGGSGSLGNGSSSNYLSGSGGGGYYGGGGSTVYGGGGGGSSWVTPTGSGDVTMTTGGSTGNGSITLTPSSTYPAPTLSGANFTSVASANGLLARGNDIITEQGAHLQWNRSLGEGETWLLNQRGGGGAYAGIRFGKSDAGDNVTEWARFIDNGNLGLGTVTPDAKIDIESSDPQQLILTSTAADPTGVITINIPATNPACATCSEMIIFKKAGTGTIGAIGANVANNTVYYNTASDKRLKEHIRPTHYGLPDLLKIEVKDYNFIGTAASNRTTGFLAQDLFRIYPEAVKEGDTGATVTNMWAVDYGKLTPLLVQAIQDQQKLIEAQRAEIDALKARATKAEATTDSFEARLRALEAGSGQARK